MTLRALIAGFGGQGSLFFGKVLSYCGLHDNKNVTNLPSYGPEMRGGTANCSVIISDEDISSPLVLNPDVLVVMNQPSYDKFIDSLVPNGIVILDSSLIETKVERKDITAYYVPAANLANEHGLSGLANIILLGKFLEVTNFTTKENIINVFNEIVPQRKAHLIPKNIEAIELGIKA